MDLFDFLWNVSQERQLDELRGNFDRARLDIDLAGGTGKLKELAQENLELKLRLGLLVRLLISKGLITAQEYAALIADATRWPPRSSTSRIVTCAPSSTSFTAIASPKPEPPPVTTATLSASRAVTRTSS